MLLELNLFTLQVKRGSNETHFDYWVYFNGY